MTSRFYIPCMWTNSFPGSKAVQTLSRLNRAHPLKNRYLCIDFMNDAEVIQFAFSDYYRTTILSNETNPNKLHDLKSALDGYQVYTQLQIDDVVSLFLKGETREKNRSDSGWVCGQL